MSNDIAKKLSSASPGQTVPPASERALGGQSRRRVRLTWPQSRALLAFDGPEPTDTTNEMQVGFNGVGNVRMVMSNLCEKGLCIRREHLNDDEGYRYELTEEGSQWCKALRAPRRYVVVTNAYV